MATYNGQMQDSSSNILLPTPHSMATIETGTTASQAYAIGDSLVYNNQLCKVTKAIASGGALTIGTNIAYNNVGAISKQLVASDGTEFYFDVLNGDYGYYPSAAKVASEFVKFGGSLENMRAVAANANSVTVGNLYIVANYRFHFNGFSVTGLTPLITLNHQTWVNRLQCDVAMTVIIGIAISDKVAISAPSDGVATLFYEIVID